MKDGAAGIKWNKGFAANSAEWQALLCRKPVSVSESN